MWPSTVSQGLHSFSQASSSVTPEAKCCSRSQGGCSCNVINVVLSVSSFCEEMNCIVNIVFLRHEK